MGQVTRPAKGGYLVKISRPEGGNLVKISAQKGGKEVITDSTTHELDVCVMRANDALRCRQEPDDPPAASLIAGWECKFYAGNLKKGLGRAFVGLMDDMGTNVRLNGFCSNSDHVQLRRYFQPQRRPHPHFRLTPFQPSNEDIFVNQIKGELKKMTAS